MSDINVSRAHGMSKDEALTKLKGIAADLTGRYGIDIDFRGDTASVKGKGVTGTANVSDTHVSLSLKLGLLLKALKGKIQGRVEEQFSEHFG